MYKFNVPLQLCPIRQMPKSIHACVMNMNGMTEGATFTRFDCAVVMSMMMETI